MIQSFLTSAITSLAVSGVLTASFIWLTKSIITARLQNAIKAEYDQKLETHKSQLKSQSDIEIANLRSQLEQAAVEHQVKFSKLQEMRASVVSETYSLLKTLFSAIADYTKPFEPAGGTPREERRKLAVEAHTKFRTFYSKNLIMVPKITADSLEAIDLELIRVFNKFALTVDNRQTTDASAFDRQMEILEKLNGDISTALFALETDFRKLLGDKC